MVALQLAEKGYGGGDPEKVLKMRVDLVLAALDFQAFQGEYKRAYMNLNKPETK